MSELRTINDFRTNDWSFDLTDLSYVYVNLYIGFADGNSVVKFNNLSFGYDLISTSGTISETYPNPGVHYDETDETYLTIDTFYLQPSTDYTLNVWSNNNNIQSTGSYQFTTPAEPPKPTPAPPSGYTATYSGI